MIVDHTLGVVLNGGDSTRMGTPKAELEHQGVMFIDHVIATMSLVVSDVVVAGGSYDGPVATLADAPEGVGPLGGIRAALERADGRPVLVCAVDMPLVTVDLLRRLVDPPVSGAEARVTEPDDGGSIQPLCAAYGPGVAAKVDAYLDAGHRSVLGLVGELDAARVPAPAITVVNVNTEAEFRELSGS